MKCCDRCGRRLVFVAIVFRDFLIKAWMCNCDYQRRDRTIPGLVADIIQAGEMKDGSVVLNLNKLKEE